MFHSPLFAQPQTLSFEEISFGLEKSFEDLDKALATAERLSLARESFACIPVSSIYPENS